MDIDLAGVTEVAELLGVTRQRVHQLAGGETFPKPIARLAAGPVWDRGVVEEWARETGRL